MTDHTALIRSYFELASLRAADAYFDQFAADAVVEDEGVERHGVEAIRDWRHEVPQVVYTVREITTTDGLDDARVAVSGDFPGSPVDLTFGFRFDAQGRISHLAIRP